MESTIRRRTPAQRAGDRGEAIVEAHLVALGWTILARNLRLGRAEVDILAVDPRPPPMLVLVEVRWRGERGFGLPEETIDWRKRRKLRGAVARLDQARNLPDGTRLPALPIRIDIIAIEPPRRPGDVQILRHHRSAVGSG